MVLHKAQVPSSIETNFGVEESRARNDRQAIFALVRELVQAQFIVSDEELVNRLWQDVADRSIDVNRVINLMYKCSNHNNDLEMIEVDELYPN